jgi:hypothetical protein
VDRPYILRLIIDFVCHPMGIHHADDGQRAERPCMAMEEGELLAELY